MGVEVDKDLKYIIAVAECRSIHKAAEVLYISQPSLSRYISGVERNFGMLLFCRSSGGMELTEAGEVYVSYAKKILALRRNMEREMQQLLSKKG